MLRLTCCKKQDSSNCQKTWAVECRVDSLEDIIAAQKLAVDSIRWIHFSRIKIHTINAILTDEEVDQQDCWQYPANDFHNGSFCVWVKLAIFTTCPWKWKLSATFSLESFLWLSSEKSHYWAFLIITNHIICWKCFSVLETGIAFWSGETLFGFPSFLAWRPVSTDMVPWFFQISPCMCYDFCLVP